MAELGAYWESPEGLAEKVEREASEQRLRDWIAFHPGVVVTRHGGYAPEQWEGSVDGHSFYFRERGGHWRIELDLVPNGRFVEVWRPDAVDGDPPTMRELTTGDVISQGVEGCPGYGETAVERAAFIVSTIRTHLRRSTCTLHTGGLIDLTIALEGAPAWCPACGAALDPGGP